MADYDKSLEYVSQKVLNKQICPTCDTGRKSYLSDKHSESCPYISVLNTNTRSCEKFKCPHYKKTITPLK